MAAHCFLRKKNYILICIKDEEKAQIYELIDKVEAGALMVKEGDSSGNRLKTMLNAMFDHVVQEMDKNSVRLRTSEQKEAQDEEHDHKLYDFFI